MRRELFFEERLGVVYITEDVYSDNCNLIGTNKFEFERHVFENHLGVDILMGYEDIRSQGGIWELLDEYREDGGT